MSDKGEKNTFLEINEQGKILSLINKNTYLENLQKRRRK